MQETFSDQLNCYDFLNQFEILQLAKEILNIKLDYRNVNDL